MILYLHGFRSSPQSAKAQLLADAVARQLPHAEWVCPQLPASPAHAIELCNNLVQKLSNPSEELVVVGSSLGGYYAGHLAHAWQCRSVVLNPVIYAARDLATRWAPTRTITAMHPLFFYLNISMNLTASRFHHLHTATATFWWPAPATKC
ncbi:YqiA/YcfP family alpha/beta fold hydrolase [Neopusillimonas aromaticivorans]|nr:YqiA/YcfP family alpha/beta fold hydrolase [Neopusillimonas aromaticivorans]WJJ92818.1 YqiA/YcfP family alpha/beta fold hydrolase [Neopusillimonas aromaticivorans]